MNEKEKKCNHRLAPSVFFGDRKLIELNYINGHYEYTAHNKNKIPVKLQFCSKCGQVSVKL